jgi:hypothetical protein
VRAFAVYTAGRVLVFAGLAALLFIAGLRGFLLIMVALLVSLPVSYVLLARPRAEFAATVERRLTARRSRRADLRSRLRGDDEPAA